MKNIIVLIFIGWLAWYGYGKYEQKKEPFQESPAVSESRGISETPLSTPIKSGNDSRFSCDGRSYCSQMTSCAEATYFLKNCPGTKMDGNHDGKPCEMQWCTN